jgi:GTP pyrophosphokinase
MTVQFFEIVDRVLSYHPKADISLLEKAYVFAAKAHRARRHSEGESYLDHPLGVAGIVADMHLDEVSIAAGLLRGSIEENLAAPEALEEAFGTDVALVVQGVAKLSQLNFSNRKERQAEYVRKMVFAMSQDIRVVLVKLADRLHGMRMVENRPEENRRLMAQETQSIYAPLAGRLGVEWMRLELEDLAFKCLQRETYEEIVQGLAKTEEERRRYISEVVRLLTDKLEDHGLDVLDVTGRSKRPYSIYKKMLAQNLELDRIHDITAFRIILETEKDCYEALALAHALWAPVSGRFKDYIAKPKSNMYQSLHTTVIGPYRERMEIQIRTEEMNRVAKEGIAAHWLYKEGKYIGKLDADETRRFSWLRQLLDWKRDWSDPKEFIEALKVDLYPDEVYVFTPLGEIKMLPKGATPVDFAYEVHSEVGHRCVGARVNGKLVPLRHELQNGDTIEILTSARQRPSKDWLKFVKAAKARERIRRWVKLEERERSIALGKEICEREFRKKGLNFNHYVNSPELLEVAESLSFRSVDDLLASIGYRKISPIHVIGKLSPALEPEELKKPAPSLDKHKVSKSSSGIRVKGIDNMMIRIARCCNPLPGEPIVGYITRGRGVTVHRTSCKNLEKGSTDRQLEVRWEVGEGQLHATDIQITYAGGKGIFAAFSAILNQLEANVIGFQVDPKSDGLSVCRLRVEVRDTDHLKRIISILKGEKNVYSVQRSME